MRVIKCNGCGNLFDRDLPANIQNGARSVGFKHACSQRCEIKVFGSASKPKLDRPPNQMMIDFRKKQPWSSVAVPIDYDHFGAK